MVSKPVYTKVEEVLDAAAAYLQASKALDCAAFFAIEVKDADALVNVASVYMQLGERLAGPEEDCEEQEELSPAFGFQSRELIVPDVFDEMEEEEDDGTED